jgi:hypothetical protein
VWRLAYRRMGVSACAPRVPRSGQTEQPRASALGMADLADRPERAAEENPRSLRFLFKPADDMTGRGVQRRSPRQGDLSSDLTQG